MTTHTKSVLSFSTIWLVLAILVLPGLAQTTTGGEQSQKGNTNSSGQGVDAPTPQTAPDTSSVPEVSFRLKPVTITATRIEKPLTAIPNTVTIVEREAITQQTTIRDDVQSILENTVPGFGPSLRRLAGRGETLRGRNPLYLIDGVPQFNALRDGQRDGKTIDPFFLERIEVIHGSNALQGVGATGGVVSMVTRSPRPDGAWTNLVRAGVTTHDSFNDDGYTYKLAGLTGKKFDRFDVMGGATFHHRGLFFDGNNDPVGLYATQGDIMDSKSWDAFFKGGYEPDSHQRFQVMVNHFTLKRDGDFRPVNGDRATGRLTTTIPGDPRNDVGDPAQNTVTTLSVDYRNKDLFNGELVSQFFYQDFAARYEGGRYGGFWRLTPDGTDQPLDQSQIESTKLGAKFIYAWNGFDLYDLTPSFGFDVFQDQSAQVLAMSGREWVPETTFNSYAPFTQIDYTVFDRVHLTGGVRYVIADVSVDDFTTIGAANSTFVSGGNPRFSEALPNGGMTIELVPQLSIYGSYAEGFTMPDVGRVLRAVNTPGQDVDSLLNLEPVVTQNLEFGFDFESSRARLHVAWYRSDAELGSRLELINNIYNVRREKTQISGVDVSGSLDVTEAMTAGFTYAYVQGQSDTDQDGGVDTDLDGVNIAPNRLNLFSEVNVGWGFGGRVQVSHFFDRDFKGPGIAERHRGKIDFSGFTLVDLFVSKDTGHGSVSLGIENLLDKQYIPYFAQTDYQRPTSFFAGPGRTMTVFYQHEF